LKWLFHPVNLLIIVVLVALYINRQTLFPELAESPEVKQLVSRVDGVIASLNNNIAELKESVQEPAPTAPAAEPEVTPTSEPVAGQSTGRDAAAIAGQQEDAGHALAPATAPPAQRFDDLPEMRPIEPVGESEPPQQAQQEAEALPPPEPQQPATAASPAPQRAAESSAYSQAAGTGQAKSAGEPLAIWKAARRAAWEGNPEQAVEHYRALIALQPDNYDAHGELGNVLLRRGDSEAAAEAYAEAAMLLTRSNYPQVAWRVLEIVSRLDQERASRLYQAMREQQLSAAQPRRQTQIPQ
jgi:tetratricopeptide (TPR) repeat protein